MIMIDLFQAVWIYFFGMLIGYFIGRRMGVRWAIRKINERFEELRRDAIKYGEPDALAPGAAQFVPPKSDEKK